MQISNPYEYLQGHVLERGETSTYVKILMPAFLLRQQFRKYGAFLVITG